MSGRKNSASNGATAGYEGNLWQMANTAVCLIFPTYFSEAFGAPHIRLEGEEG